MKHTIIIIILSLGLVFSGCLKEVLPSDAITTATLTQSTEGLTKSVNGAYSLFKDHIEFNGTIDLNRMYLRQYFQLSDFASDDIACGQVTTDPFFLSFTLDHTPTQSNTRYFWYISYKIINNVNTVIEAGEKVKDPDEATQQLIGECYFLRAFCNFNLVKFFAEPYTQNASGPGIILRTSTSDPAQKARATVEEVYQSIIKDAEKGASLMNQSRGVQYATKEAAWALLSRAYLYREDHDNTILYSNKVINSGKFSLETASSFPSYFANATSRAATIFCIAFTDVDDYGKASISSMLYSDGNSGWGEEFASKSLRDSMATNPGDKRWSYIIPQKDGSGNVKKLNGIDIYYISKFSFQNDNPSLSSPVMFRLAEMYLNKAEAEAKKGMISEALNDVDMIRKNRGLENSLYNGAVPVGYQAIDIVLRERRFELAFEGHRSFDVYRNKKSMNRTYWGYHLPGLKETDIVPSQNPSGYANMIVNPDNARVIYYIPVDETQANPLCSQNP